jgi:hypothetical protein
MSLSKNEVEQHCQHDADNNARPEQEFEYEFTVLIYHASYTSDSAGIQP